MTSVPTWTKRVYIFAFSAILLTGASLTGCATFKEFVPQEDKRNLKVFPGHEIETLFKNSIYAEDNNNFSLDICQRQAAPTDSSNVHALPHMRLTELRLLFNGEGDPVCPEPEEPDTLAWRGILDDGFLHGPVHSWGKLHIPESCEFIEITYVAELVGQGNEGGFKPQPVRQVLYRRHDRVSSMFR